ncbi:phage capsid protein, partial [Salmonella enterica subsp. enterica serovar Montevideo]|nr:phage capsid protein [Salmonella enterica subsp. enterica serovar Montevideo]
PPDDTAQGDDKLQALANAVNELEGRVAKIENQLNDVQGDVDTIAEVVDTEEFAAIRDNAKDIVKRFNDLGNKSVRTPGRKISEKAGKFNFL